MVNQDNPEAFREKKDPIVKTIKIPPAEHHSAAWKVAYADFVTAMMAFFLLLWLMNSVNSDSLQGIAEYFTPISLDSGFSGAEGDSGGRAVNPGKVIDQSLPEVDHLSKSIDKTFIKTVGDAIGREDDITTGDIGLIKAEEEEEFLQQLKENINATIEDLPQNLAYMTDILEVFVNEEGIHLVLIDNDTHRVFHSDTAEFTTSGQQSVSFIGQLISQLPNRVAVVGYVDSLENPDNPWQLSINRAEAAREQIEIEGVLYKKFEHIAGRATFFSDIGSENIATKSIRLQIMLRRFEVKELIDNAGIIR